MAKTLTEKNTEINQQYKPIEAMINNIPDDSIEVDGVKYAKAVMMIKVGLMLIVHHCKNMKLINADFEAPFSKKELEELVSAPFTEGKLTKVKKLRDEYDRLDKQAYSNNKGEQGWLATA